MPIYIRFCMQPTRWNATNKYLVFVWCSLYAVLVVGRSSSQEVL